MKWKNLLPLIVILAILVVLVVLKQKQEKPITIVDQVQLTPLLPEGLKPADLAKVELYAGAAADDNVVLARSADDAESIFLDPPPHR